MIPIVEYPSVVSSYLPAFFESVFTRPQVKNFARYITGLMISTNRTISAMNDLFYAHNDQSALNNFITEVKNQSVSLFSGPPKEPLKS